MERCREDKETVQCERAMFLFVCTQADGATGRDTLSLKCLYHSCHLLDSKQTRVRARHLCGTDASWYEEYLQSHTRTEAHTKSSVSCLGKWKEGASFFLSRSFSLFLSYSNTLHTLNHTPNCLTVVSQLTAISYYQVDAQIFFNW